MARIPRSVRNVLEGWQGDFSPTVWNRFFAILMAAILIRGRRTILRVHTLADQLAPGHVSSLHRVFSHRRWSIMALARILAVTIVETLAPEGTLELVGDDDQWLGDQSPQTRRFHEKNVNTWKGLDSLSKPQQTCRHSTS